MWPAFAGGLWRKLCRSGCSGVSCISPLSLVRSHCPPSLCLEETRTAHQGAAASVTATTTQVDAEGSRGEVAAGRGKGKEEEEEEEEEESQRWQDEGTGRRRRGLGGGGGDGSLPVPSIIPFPGFLALHPCRLLRPLSFCLQPPVTPNSSLLPLSPLLGTCYCPAGCGGPSCSLTIFNPLPSSLAGTSYCPDGYGAPSSSIPLNSCSSPLFPPPRHLLLSCWLWRPRLLSAPQATLPQHGTRQEGQGLAG